MNPVEVLKDFVIQVGGGLLVIFCISLVVAAFRIRRVR